MVKLARIVYIHAYIEYSTTLVIYELKIKKLSLIQTCMHTYMHTYIHILIYT